MKVPDSQIRIRVDEVFRQIENNFNAWRDGATTGSLSAVKGFIGNRIQRVSNQSSPTLAATVAQSAKTLIFSAISKAHIPGVSHLADGVSLLIDSATKLGELLTAKGIEHEQKKYLLAASLSDQPDSQEIKKQGEYFALDGAQKVVDAIRKAQKALTDTYDAYNRMYIPDINLADCGTFVDFLTRAHYLYYRVDRLQYYNSRLQRWAAMVEAQLKDLQKECEDMKGDTYDVAEEIVHNAITDDDWQKHDKLCNRKPCCLFTPQWLNEYWRSPSLISEQTTPPPTQGPLRQGPPPAIKIKCHGTKQNPQMLGHPRKVLLSLRGTSQARSLRTMRALDNPDCKRHSYATKSGFRRSRYCDSGWHREPERVSPVSLRELRRNAGGKEVESWPGFPVHETSVQGSLVRGDVSCAASFPSANSVV